MPRHSTGCRNCVRRRILCDESQPSCRNCRMKKIECDGPQEGLQVILVSMKTSINRSSPKSLVCQVVDQACTIEKSSFSRPAKPNTPTSLEWSHSRFHTRLSYLMTNAADGDRVWLEYCARKSEDCPIAIVAIDALATAMYAKRRPNFMPLHAAAAKYTKALIKLRDALEGVNDSRFDILAAITAMNRYEVLTSTDERACVQHAGGISKIVELAGPSVFHQYPFSIILDCNRFRIIHEAYHQRKPTFLRQSRWKALRHGLSEAELHFLDLYDLYGALADVAALVTGSTEINVSDCERYQYALVLVTNLITDLDKWAVLWVSLLRLCTSKSLNNSTDIFYSDSEGLVFAESLSYPNVRAAVGMNMCMALKIMAIEWKHKLENPGWSPGLANENMVEIPQASYVARNICCGLHVYFPKDQPEKILNPLYLMFSAFIAAKAFHKRSREMRWLQGIFERVADLTGIELARAWTKNYQNKWSA